jgi:hypothetical protein
MTLADTLVFFFWFFWVTFFLFVLVVLFKTLLES